MIMRIAARLQPLRLVAVLLAAAACLGAAICVARAIGAGVTGFAQ
jgi:F0F1-type ATP synthase membrane subunit c/vacuolar-type H+-ATPase subunit K